MPAWFAAMVQVPGLRPVTVLPLTVQTPGVEELKLTASPEVAVALASRRPTYPQGGGIETDGPDGLVEFAYRQTLGHLGGWIVGAVTCLVGRNSTGAGG